MSRTVAVVPARWASTRFPGKPLADLLGKPMIRHVWERARAVRAFDAVLVATDDARIAEACRGFGATVAWTRDDHPTGTDRLAEVAEREPADVYVNVQGDEPLVDPAALEALAATMRARPEVGVGTLCHPIGADEARDPNRVKLVRADDGTVLYFSRSPIPYPRDPEAASYLQHVGVYAYRREVLRRYPSLPRPAIERAESLEQLRLLAAGVPIVAIEAGRGAPGVDTPEDLVRVAALLRAAR